MERKEKEGKERERNLRVSEAAVICSTCELSFFVVGVEQKKKNGPCEGRIILTFTNARTKIHLLPRELQTCLSLFPSSSLSFPMLQSSSYTTLILCSDGGLAQNSDCP